MFSDFKSTFPQVTIFSLSQVPVVEIQQNCKALISASNSLVDKVDKILVAKRANAKADTTSLEAEIDQIVYHLYGLTTEEIKIVKDATA